MLESFPCEEFRPPRGLEPVLDEPISPLNVHVGVYFGAPNIVYMHGLLLFVSCQFHLV